MILIFTSILFLLGKTNAQINCARCTDYKNLSLPIGSSSPEVELVVNNFYLDNGCKMANFKCVVVKTGCTTAAYISNSNTGEELAIYETSKTESIGGNVTCVAAASSGIGWRFNGVQPLFNCKTFCPSDGAGEAPADLTFPPEETTTTEKPSAGGCKVE
ncbi:hypothetical protein B9Z55_021728 [Caenorhabditis nigoni]|uniref:DUF281 domain-containing protein n=1 Tax=Caenorhabditis nigoni TaxID=1611254 RepID=A0A2G5TTA2_9PELO|nr:hypothetical protein B9Z55_021728 [Caenorhabditis nigoni]